MANRKAEKDKPNADMPDEYDRDLERDNDRSGGTRQAAGAGGGPSGNVELDSQLPQGFGPVNHQKDRKGQAQSPRELTPNEPPREKEGH